MSDEPPAPSHSSSHSKDDKSHDPHALFPQKWTTRWPQLVVVGVVVAALANFGHIFAGIEALSHFAEKLVSHRKPEPTQPPLVAKISEQQTRSLDGYSFVSKAAAPRDGQPGPVYAGGVTTQLVLQTTDAKQIVQIDSLTLQVDRKDVYDEIAYNYLVDPLRQSGFGTARLSEYMVSFDSGSVGSVLFVSDKGESLSAAFPDLLPKNTRIRLDQGKNDLQDALIVNLIPTKRGLYKVSFKVRYTSLGKEGEIATAPLFIVRK